MSSQLARLIAVMDARELKAALIRAFAPQTVEVRSYVTPPKSRIKAFVFERCELAEGATVLKREIHAAYVAWCESKGFEPMIQPAFGKSLVATEPAIVMGRGIYRGVRLKP